LLPVCLLGYITIIIKYCNNYDAPFFQIIFYSHISFYKNNFAWTIFPIRIGLHQGSALSPYLFALVMDEVTRDIQGDIPWSMLFTDDVVLIDESQTGVNQKLEL